MFPYFFSRVLHNIAGNLFDAVWTGHMVINDEIKFPRHIRFPPFKTETRVNSIDHAAAIERIGKFSRRWEQIPERRQTRKEKKSLSAGEIFTVRRMVAEVNQDLNRHGLLIRLVLAGDDDGYFLDIYDCTDNKLCKIVKDIVINVEELQFLMNNLDQEAGLLVDTIL